ncbi:hypothetical protein FXN61_13930 [Lentzea sp. PSKA42]|uniref:Uncharacterized protein n=1 Tax=Lentzea indica TaxID=2604800 RepID=A0ABX1FGV4_9PSEU|nr:hypothetical protein [Lentzea indica]NKE57871.1 hypothetical protein [Lentzea indica]
MKLTFLRGECGNERTCPNLNVTDRGTLVVQGYVVTDSVVEIPLTLVPEVVSHEHPEAHLKLTGHSTVLVRGLPVTDPEALRILNLPHGEGAVEVPLSAFPPEVQLSAR